jgi:hypothetical protein
MLDRKIPCVYICTYIHNALYSVHQIFYLSWMYITVEFFSLNFDFLHLKRYGIFLKYDLYFFFCHEKFFVLQIFSCILKTYFLTEFQLLAQKKETNVKQSWKTRPSTHSLSLSPGCSVLLSLLLSLSLCLSLTQPFFLCVSLSLAFYSLSLSLSLSLSGTLTRFSKLCLSLSLTLLVFYSPLSLTPIHTYVHP